MKKTLKLITALMLVALVLSVSAFAIKADTVTYEGASQKFIFDASLQKNPTDLFSSFKDVMPGDKITDSIFVVDKASEKVDLKVYLRSRGAEQGSSEFLSKLTLNVKQNGKELFNATADKPAGLTDWVCLGTFKSGEETKLDLELNVPIELGDEFQNAEGTILWDFKIEEIPIEEPVPPAPVTGIAKNAFWAFIMVASVAGLVAFIVIDRKKKSAR